MKSYKEGIHSLTDTKNTTERGIYVYMYYVYVQYIKYNSI